MHELLHRVRVFVFRYEEGMPRYLLLRSAQGIEGLWTPLHGPIGFGEKLEAAIRREVAHDTGINRSLELLDLEMPAHWLLGDEEIIEWNFGFRADPSRVEPSLDASRWKEYLWADFAAAYPTLELEGDRAAIMRLHAMLNAA